MLQVGDEFQIDVDGQTVTVVCLSGGQQSRLLALLAKVQKCEADQRIEEMGPLFLKALTMCVGDVEKAEVLFETKLDFDMIGKVIAATTGKNALTDEDKKKLD